ncbi:hypothetical protein DL766_009821 [Monosporascus sp. MC13-8B]|uniref:Protein BNI4 n=1 Tax=Monosporascus cannonballus TaxID=155416 RepID=A0ABY0GWR5_9PEZI|nr:hypothetical protein DL762_008261 [Monosporascus cannonballus]RYO81621.1 hypothetical protein DL763_008525 [Monosporascus cannonballus]RYP13641.1 hypothetical protein DL766_009821 [Monosporascus sp. MC13-8B]
MAGTSQTSSGQQYGGHSHRNSFSGKLPGNVGGQTAYRGNTAGPIQPYAFTSTPSLASNGQRQQQYGGHKAPTSPSNQPVVQMVDTGPAAVSRPSTVRQFSAQSAGSGQPTFAQVAATKASPERYRRPAPKHTDSSHGVMQQPSQPPGSALPSGSGMATVVHLYNPAMTTDRKAAIPRNSAQLASSRPHTPYGTVLGTSVDDIHVPRLSSEEDVKRFRRRSLHSIDFSNYPNPMTPQEFKQVGDSLRAEAPTSRKKTSSLDKEQKAVARVVALPAVEKNLIPTRGGSSESLDSSRSIPTGNSPASTSSTSGEKPSQDHPKLVNVPPRSSSTDVSGKRVLSPSPLSHPVTMATGPSSGAAAPSENLGAQPAPPGSSHGPGATSPAAKQLAAINEKGGKAKSKTSRLRRAFSFGSAAELRKVTGQDGESSRAALSNEPNRLHKDPRPEDLYEEEQARIAQKQEEGGIGSSIYSGTKLFSGSTDNLSVSSTASSASIMLRKMGRGVKKSSRSLVGLFRPKSVIGAPAADSAATDASHAAVSMITAEAERERVNVNPDVHAQQAGGTGFPRLERNSIDASKPRTDSLMSDRPGSGSSAARKSIVGGEKERAEVLATIRKGILKIRSDSPSPSPGASTPAFDLPMIPTVTDSPNSSAPSTPKDDGQSQKRNGSIAIGSEDYFMSALRLRQDTKSAPVTPQGPVKRNATFSPRIVFYDTWPSGEYDRRGDIATCNRLTPMLAQQIKEELNTFKMVLDFLPKPGSET